MSLEVIFLYCALFIVCLVYFLRKKSPISQFVKKVGGPPRLPFLGNSLEFINNFDRTLVTLSNWIDKYGGRFVFSVGPTVVFTANDAKDLEIILTSMIAIEKSKEYDLSKSWLGEGLITSKGQHWMHRRKFITPTFHFSILESFVGPIDAHANILLDVLDKNFIASEEKPVFKDICPFISRCTLDIICETAMGKQMSTQTDGTSDYVEAIHKVGELFQYRVIRPWLLPEFIWKLTRAGNQERKYINTINSFTYKVIEERRSFLNNGPCFNDTNEPVKCINQDDNFGKPRLAFLDLLLQGQRYGEDISDIGIRDETTTFIFAGHDTVSVAVSFCLFNLGNSPEVQEKLHRELDMIFKGNNSRQISSADLKEMKYLECCIKESLRLYPSVPVLGRLLRQPLKLDEDLTIPSGVTIFCIPYKLHRNSKYFPKPDEFIPERFATGSCMANRNPFAYIPFSAGPRNCIGQKYAMMEAKIMLARVLKRFKVKSLQKPEQLEVLSEIVLRPKGGIMLQLQERK